MVKREGRLDFPEYCPNEESQEEREDYAKIQTKILELFCHSLSDPNQRFDQYDLPKEERKVISVRRDKLATNLNDDYSQLGQVVSEILWSNLSLELVHEISSEAK